MYDLLYSGLLFSECLFPVFVDILKVYVEMQINLKIISISHFFFFNIHVNKLIRCAIDCDFEWQLSVKG